MRRRCRSGAIARIDASAIGSSMRLSAASAAALAALSRIELPIADASMRAIAPERQRLRIELDSTALPGALRLPALVDAAWRQAPVERTWPGIPAA